MGHINYCILDNSTVYKDQMEVSQVFTGSNNYFMTEKVKE